MVVRVAVEIEDLAPRPFGRSDDIVNHALPAPLTEVGDALNH